MFNVRVPTEKNPGNLENENGPGKVIEHDDLSWNFTNFAWHFTKFIITFFQDSESK